MSEVNKTLFDHSDSVEETYVTQADVFKVYENPILERLIRENSIKSILDIGTGEGYFIHNLALKYADIHFTAIDADPKLIAKACKYQLSNLQFECHEFSESYNSPNTYDLVLARFSVEHMQSPEDFVKIANNHLAENGLLFITEWYIDQDTNQNSIWKEFRTKELQLYQKIKSHPRLALVLPQYFKHANYENISSIQALVAPSTVGNAPFYRLSNIYVNLYGLIFPEEFSVNFVQDFTTYCQTAMRSDNQYIEDSFQLSFTLGRKQTQFGL